MLKISHTNTHSVNIYTVYIHAYDHDSVHGWTTHELKEVHLPKVMGYTLSVVG